MFQKQPTNKYRFYHIPKNGGTAIFTMTQKWKNHKRAHPHKNHVKLIEYPPQPDEIAYTVIRHPYSRFTSAFYHLVDSCKDEFYYKHAKVSDCDWLQHKQISMDIFHNDPNVFLQALMEKIHPYHKEAQAIFHHFDILKPQFYWVSNLWGTHIDTRLQKIIHQENLEREFQEIADNLGEYTFWPRDRSANTRLTQNTIPLNDQSKAIIRSIYYNDFKHFGFSA
jgi:hypothetical protein